MSSENIARKKRGTSEANPAPDADHRKRRRNRTTQSCLNCHTSKRMCDRKRPACARCTQLGLTGLCVYEVDDPSQRSDTQDESSRLLKRVAELEGVIRELKNKPHPRWSQSNCPGRENDKWHSRSQIRAECGASADQSPGASSPTSLSPLDKGDLLLTSDSSTRPSPNDKPSNIYPQFFPSSAQATRSRPSSSQSQYYNSSPQSTPSPSIMTPTEEYCQPHIAIAGQPEASQDYDLTSMFLAYPSLAGCENGDFGLLKMNQADESCFMKQHGGHCGCLHESASYNVVLELSIRLRKAADVLARSASHHIGSDCLLNQRISDLDTFTTNALGNIATPDDLSLPLLHQERPCANNAALNIVQSAQIYGSQLCGPSPGSTASSHSHSLHSLRSWDLMPVVSNSPGHCDDSFMSWEPPRRA